MSRRWFVRGASALCLAAVSVVGCGSGDTAAVSADRVPSTARGAVESTSTSTSISTSPTDGVGAGSDVVGAEADGSPPGSGGAAGAVPTTTPAAQSKSFSIDADGNVTEGPAVVPESYSAPLLDQRLAAAGEDYCLLVDLADDLLAYGDVPGEVQGHLNTVNAEVHRRLIAHHPELAGELERVVASLSAGDPVDAYRSSLRAVVEVDSRIFVVSDERCAQE